MKFSENINFFLITRSCKNKLSLGKNFLVNQLLCLGFKSSELLLLYFDLLKIFITKIIVISVEKIVHLEHHLELRKKDIAVYSDHRIEQNAKIDQLKKKNEEYVCKIFN